MFETLVETKREKAAAHTALAFPAALGAQVILACALLLHSFFSIGVLQPPTMWLQRLPDVIPVALPVVQQAPRSANSEQAAPNTTPRRSELMAPNQVDSVIKPEALNAVDTYDPSVPVDDDLAKFLTGLSNPDARNRSSASSRPGATDNGIRRGGDFKAPHLVRKVSPEYPPPAIAMRLTGRVVVQLVVNEEGRVVDAQVLTSTNVIFNEAALRAVRQWVFTRPIDAQSQQAVSCYLPVVVEFTLN